MGLPISLFDESVERGNIKLQMRSELGELSERPFCGYLLDLAVSIRRGDQDCAQKHSYAFSKQIVRLVLNSVFSAEDATSFVEKSIAKLQDMAKSERSVVFEMLGCALDTFCLEDEVKYNHKRRSTYSSTNTDRMTVKPGKKHKDTKNDALTVFSDVAGEKITVNKCEISIVRPAQIKISKESQTQMIAILGNPDTDFLTISQLLKFFLL